MGLSTALLLASLAAAPLAEKPPADAPLTAPFDDRTGELGLQDLERLDPLVESLKVSKGLEAAVLIVDGPDLPGRCRQAAEGWRRGKAGDWALLCVAPAGPVLHLEVAASLRTQLTPEVVGHVVERGVRRAQAGNVADGISSVLDDLFTPPHVPRLDRRFLGLVLGFVPFLFGFVASLGWSRKPKSNLASRALLLALVAWSAAGTLLLGWVLADAFPGQFSLGMAIGFFMQLPGAIAWAILHAALDDYGRVPRRQWIAVVGFFVLGGSPPALATFTTEMGFNKLAILTVVSSLLAPFVALIISGPLHKRG